MGGQLFLFFLLKLLPNSALAFPFLFFMEVTPAQFCVGWEYEQAIRIGLGWGYEYEFEVYVWNPSLSRYEEFLSVGSDIYESFEQCELFFMLDWNHEFNAVYRNPDRQPFFMVGRITRTWFS